MPLGILGKNPVFGNLLLLRSSSGRTIAGALAALKNGDATKAAELICADVERAANSNPDFWIASHRIFFAAGDVLQAERALDVAGTLGARDAALLRMRASFLETLHRWDEAASCWEKLHRLDKNDADPTAQLIKCTLRFDLPRAVALLNDFASLKDRHFGVYQCHIGLAEAEREYERAFDLWRAATKKFPRDPRSWAGLTRAYYSRGETDAALSMCSASELKKRGDVLRLAYLDVLLGAHFFREAERVIGEISSRSGNALKIAHLSSRRHSEAGDVDQAISVLEPKLDRRRGAVAHIVRLASLYLSAGRREDAHRVAGWIAPEFDSRSDVAEMRSWQAADRDDFETARALWAEGAVRHLRPTRPLDAPLIPNREPGKAPHLQLFGFLRNEMDRLPFFLDYYRRLGVPRFLLVDNASSDGSYEYLASQDDVVLFRTEQRYSKSHAGLRWMNHLVGRFGGDGWALHVDVDEFFVLPHFETNSINRHYLPYLERNGFEAVTACMIDMYSKHPSQGAAYRPGADPLDFCPYFDPEMECVGQFIAPYRKVSGGIRARKFGQHALLQMKTPLIRSDIGISFISSSHYITPAKVADLSGAVLHYKYLGRFQERLAEEAARREHWNGAMFVVQLRDQVNSSIDSDWTNSQSLTYRDSQQLIELGLIESGEFKPA